MSTTRKIAVGLGVASSALITAWLFTGDRKKKTKAFIVKKAGTITRSLYKDRGTFDDSEAHYI
jgi:hypothetical protein